MASTPSSRVGQALIFKALTPLTVLLGWWSLWAGSLPEQTCQLFLFRQLSDDPRI